MGSSRKSSPHSWPTEDFCSEGCTLTQGKGWGNQEAGCSLESFQLLFLQGKPSWDLWVPQIRKRMGSGITHPSPLVPCSLGILQIILGMEQGKCGLLGWPQTLRTAKRKWGQCRSSFSPAVLPFVDWKSTWTWKSGRRWRIHLTLALQISSG